MCGIFGLVLKKESHVGAGDAKNIAESLFCISESRGREASGMAIYRGEEVFALKQPVPASQLIRTDAFDRLWQQGWEKGAVRSFIGHARLVTNGSLEDNLNNQPVVKGDIVAVHNGIIVNEGYLWTKYPNLTRASEVDTEVLLALIRYFLDQGESLSIALARAFKEIKGTASVALFVAEYNALILATNNGSLYVARMAEGIVFASEEIFLKKFFSKEGKVLGKNIAITQIMPGEAAYVSLGDALCTVDTPEKLPLPDLLVRAPHIQDISEYTHQQKQATPPPNLSAHEHHHEDQKNAISLLRRCAKCILPETMPFIEFDGKGVCNYCRHHKLRFVQKESELKNLANKYRGNEKKADIVISLSGGRDSSYALHYAKKVLDLHPVAISYDWGMITDLGRRNQARMCGELGVEHILISADIRKKRRNIRKNILAWLRRPDLGIIPLFMAGDKQYFYHLNAFMSAINIPFTLYSENPLEKTDFKSGFCNVPPEFIERGTAYALSLDKKLRMIGYYLKRFAGNPAYVNSALFDTMSAYVSSYFIPHNYVYMFDYLPWNETEIVGTLRREYDWELATDTESTWRIGDGTAPFYNYIYYNVAGFTENDTFHSNQVREGLITRNEALLLAERDNAPRWESLRWYFETINVDMKDALRAIEKMPKRYATSID